MIVAEALVQMRATRDRPDEMTGTDALRESADAPAGNVCVGDAPSVSERTCQLWRGLPVKALICLGSTSLAAQVATLATGDVPAVGSR